MWTQQDVGFMQMALDLAAKGLGKTWPNPMVGAVIVKNRKIIGRGWHKCYGRDHAEVMALKQAGPCSKGATVYVSLEPCCHFGKTPPCVNALINAKVRRVVVAMQDPNPKVQGKGLKLLKRAGIEVQKGLLEREAAKLNRVFIKTIKSGLPYVISKAAITLDGKIAGQDGRSKWITGEKARKKAHELRKLCQAVIIGGGTAYLDDPLLTVRLKRTPLSQQPLRIVVEGKRMLAPTSQLAKTADKYPLVIVTPKEPKQHSLYGNKHIGIWSFPNKHQRVDLKSLLSYLNEKGISLVMVEGGSRLQASFFGMTKEQQENYVDEIYWMMAPKLFGNQNALSVVGGDLNNSPGSSLDVKITQINPIGQDWLIQGLMNR